MKRCDGKDTGVKPEGKIMEKITKLPHNSDFSMQNFILSFTLQISDLATGRMIFTDEN